MFFVLQEKLSKEKSAPLEPPAPEPQMPSLTNHTSSLSAAMSSLMPSLESFMEGAEAAGGRLSVANMLHAPLAASRAQEPAPINQQNLQQVSWRAQAERAPPIYIQTLMLNLLNYV